jgi:MFS family permease
VPAAIPGADAAEGLAMGPPRTLADVGMTPARVVRTYVAVSGLFTLSASVIWAVNTLFLLEAGLDIFEVFIANAAFTAGMVIFEIPTGVVADTSGRRRSFLLSTVTLLLGTLAYVVIAASGGGLVPFVLASLVLGLGFSFYSGAFEAWLVERSTPPATTANWTTSSPVARWSRGAAQIVGTVTLLPTTWFPRGTSVSPVAATAEASCRGPPVAVARPPDTVPPQSTLRRHRRYFLQAATRLVS